MVNRRKNILETPKRRQRRRRRAIIKLILFVFGLLILIGLGLWFFRTSSLRISEVDVLGTNEINPDIIKDKANELSSGNDFLFLPRNQVLLYPRKQIETTLRNDFKEASSVSVKLVGLTKVAITIQERIPYALYCLDTCYFSDQSGFVYKDADASSTDSYVSFHDTRYDNASSSASSSSPLGTYPLKTSDFQGLENFARDISTLKLHTQEVLIGLDDDVSILTDQGKILVSINNPLDQQFDLLKIALTQGPFLKTDGSVKSFGYIDVRFGNKVFYKMGKDVATTTSSSTNTVVQ